MSFRQTYGPWALIAGASEGTGAAFAKKLAARGLNCILAARREAPLAALADELRAEHAIECLTVRVDLAAGDACDRLVEAVGEREVGLYISNAGSDVQGARFLDRDIQAWLDLLNRNATTTMRCCHHFGRQMRARRRGGLLLVGSGAGYGGSSFMATYAGSKAFEMCFAEGLWAELRDHGVDVLYYSLGATDTPALRALLAEKGLPPPPELASPDEVTEVGLANLAHGPIRNWGQENDVAGYAPMSPDARRARILAIDQATKRIFGGRSTDRQ